MKTSQRINAGDEFWEEDLEQIEGFFLKKRKKITDLPAYLDVRVYPQGSVILNNARKINVNPPSFMDRLMLKLDRFFGSK